MYKRMSIHTHLARDLGALVVRLASNRVAQHVMRRAYALQVVLRHVFGHVFGCVFRHVFGHMAKHVCGHVFLGHVHRHVYRDQVRRRGDCAGSSG